MKLNEVKYDYKSRHYPAESWNTLTEEQQVYIGLWKIKFGLQLNNIVNYLKQK